MLSTHALLTAIGIQSDAALPLSAVASWVLKDGLGSAGVMLTASRLGKAMDSHLKTSRWLSDVGMVVGTTLEMATPLVPPLWFLPLASVANTFKGLAGLTNGASKAALHQHFARDGNMAEITAQSHSQQTACYLLGTAAGLGLTALPQLWLPFVAVSAMQLWCARMAIAGLHLRSLDALRFPLLVRHHLLSGTVPSPAALAAQEQWMWAWLRRRPVRIGTSVRVFADATQLEAAIARSRGAPYLLHCEASGDVSVVLGVNASDAQVVEAVWQAYVLHFGGADVASERFAAFESALRTQGWLVEESASLEASAGRVRAQW